MVHSSGKAGHNVEYVLKIAQWMRHTLPEVMDEHLYALEHHIRRMVRQVWPLNASFYILSFFIISDYINIRNGVKCTL